MWKPIYQPEPWTQFVKRKDIIGLPLMEQRRKHMEEQMLFENYVSSVNAINTISTAAGGPAPTPSTGGGGTPSYTALTNTNFQTAVNLWFSDQAAAEAAYGPIGQWNTTAVTSMANAFQNRDTFNEDLGSWDMSNVVTPAFMFLGATSFNNGGSDSINNWDMTGVPNGAAAGLASMFQNATSFNQPLGNWDVTEIANFTDIFNGATSFNQDLSSWTPTKMVGLFVGRFPRGFNRGFLNTAMSTANYDALLIAWSALTFTNANIPFSMNQTTQYSAGAAATARGVLTGAPNNWTITDGGQA